MYNTDKTNKEKGVGAFKQIYDDIDDGQEDIDIWEDPTRLDFLNKKKDPNSKMMNNFMIPTVLDDEAQMKNDIYTGEEGGQEIDLKAFCGKDNFENADMKAKKQTAARKKN